MVFFGVFGLFGFGGVSWVAGVAWLGLLGLVRMGGMRKCVREILQFRRWISRSSFISMCEAEI